jgi:DNA modification methylase
MISATQQAHIRSIHPFPARMAPSIVWDALPNSNKALRVLDPMSGSGTTLVCAKAKGHHAIGCDTDPLALLIARSWCTDVDPRKLKQRGTFVLVQAKKLAEKTSFYKGYPDNSDEETERFIDFWFDAESRRQLAALARCISGIRCENDRTLLWCAFSRLIITKNAGVSLARDISHSRPHKAYDRAVIQPFDKFSKSVEYVADSCPFICGSENGLSANIRYGDARNLPIETEAVDMIITSPPYLNAIDYLRGHKFSLVWMGHNISELRRIRSRNIGTEVSGQEHGSCIVVEAMKAMGNIGSLDNRRFGMVRRYTCDMNKVIKECRRVLKRHGRAIFVIGDSSIYGVFIRNSEGLIKIAESHGLSLVSKTRRAIEDNKRYLPPPSFHKAGTKMQRRIRYEVILTFERLE